MTHVLALLAELKPDRRQLAFFGLLWLKILVFFTLVFNADQRNFSLAALNNEIFRSLLRPAWYSLVFFTVLAGLNLFAPHRRLRAFLVGNLLLSALLLVDLWYYRAFRVFPSFSMLHAYRNLELSTDLVLPFLRWYDLALLADLAVLKLPWLRLPRGGGPGWRRLVLQGGCFLGLFFLVRPVAANVVGSKAALDPFRPWDPVAETIATTPIGFHALELGWFLLHGGAGGTQLTAEDRSRIGAWLERNPEHLPAGPLRGALAGRNLLVIQVESLEAFVLDLSVQGQAVTPRLNALKRRGIYFSQFHEQVNRGVSSDADLMTNASTYPLRGMPTFCVCPDSALPSLPRILARNGYQCLSIHPDKGSIWNATQGLTGLGFRPCLDRAAFDCRDEFGIGLTDASLFEQVEPLLLRQKQPFYAFMVTQSSHLPFEPPDRVRELLLSPPLDGMVMGGYLQSVHYTDKHLGLFLERLERRGLLENTVVVVTGDHQGVHKFYAQELAQSPLREPWWEDSGHRLPFLILAKGLHPRECGVHGGQVDIMPTLLDLLGLDPEPGGVMGRNLLNTRRNLCVLNDGSVVGQGSPEEVKHCVEGLGIADLIIRGRYHAGEDSGQKVARNAP